VIGFARYARFSVGRLGLDDGLAALHRTLDLCDRDRLRPTIGRAGDQTPVERMQHPQDGMSDRCRTGVNKFVRLALQPGKCIQGITREPLG
jgi:hypothetical protein